MVGSFRSILYSIEQADFLFTLIDLLVARTWRFDIRHLAAFMTDIKPISIQGPVLL